MVKMWASFDRIPIPSIIDARTLPARIANAGAAHDVLIPSRLRHKQQGPAQWRGLVVCIGVPNRTRTLCWLALNQYKVDVPAGIRTLYWSAEPALGCLNRAIVASAEVQT